MKKRNALLVLILFIIVIIPFSCSDPEFNNQGKGIDQNLDLNLRSKLPKDVLDSTLKAERTIPKNQNSNSATTELQLQSTSSVNYALQSVVSAESTYPGYSVSRIKDGSRNTTVGPSYSWANNYPAGGRLPESVFLKWYSLKTVDRIDIYTSTGYALQNYTIQYRTTSTAAWVTLLSVTGNTDVYRTHSFAPLSLLQVQIICELGPSNQTIYGRLNEVEIYGEPEPAMPPISEENGMLAFDSHADLIQTIDYLEYKYEQYDDAFLAQYPGYTVDQLGDIEESIGHNDEQPYIDFESMFGIYSKRAELTAAEDYWLATTPADYAYDSENPDAQFVEDDEVRTIVNSYGEVKVGATYYYFNPDGTWYEIAGPYYSEMVSLRNRKPSDPLPPHVKKAGGPSAFFIFPDPDCRWSERYRNHKDAGVWRAVHVTSIWNHPWSSRVMAKTKSYKKIDGHWKKRRALIKAQVYGTIQNKDCEGAQNVESGVEEGTKRKVKAKVTSGVTIRANKNDVQSSHYHDADDIKNFDISLTW